MDKYEVRRLNLRALMRTHCGDKIAALADRIGRSASYASRMLYPEGKSGKKRIGEDMRDAVEDAFALERGTLDNEESAIAELGVKMPEQGNAETGADAPKRMVDQMRPGGTLTNVSSLTETTLERLDADEKRILELYRRATRDGKLMIYGAATVAPKESEAGISFPRPQ